MSAHFVYNECYVTLREWRLGTTTEESHTITKGTLRDSFAEFTLSKANVLRTAAQTDKLWRNIC